eukprot:gb/GFBE01024205.1/.p1 GENE.gb/GFBE01024205.1/~~gb/GFBE01024205.1/.p1  ORF type:complete len:698 (+),score=300.18 gb/GFBE01024205.1/:1-2094(+)
MARGRKMRTAVMLALGLACMATASKTTAAAGGPNPIRKVVNLMQKMSEKISQEAEEEKDLYDKFMCHCKTELADFEKGKAEFEAAVPKLESDIETAKAQIAQLTQEIEQAKADEAQTEEDMKNAEAERSKDHEKYEKEVKDMDENLDALNSAIPTLEAAMGGAAAFIQVDSSSQVLSRLSQGQLRRLQRVVGSSKSVTESERDMLSSFLEDGAASDGIGEVKGLLTAQKEDIEQEEAATKAEENKDLNIFQELMAAKKNEKEAIEETTADKIDRLGGLKVSLVELKGELSDAQNALSKDFDVLSKLKESCDEKTKEWDERETTRAEELKAIQETIKILNDDDTLDLFRKTLPSPVLLQLQRTADEARSKALSVVRGYAVSQGQEAIANRTGVDLVMLALSSKGVDFSLVMKMINNMTDLMDQEQKDDDKKKAYCEKQAFENTRKTKALRHKIKTLEDAVATKEEALETAAAEIKELQAGVAELDKSVAESTDMRQKEHAEYQKLIQEQAATKDVLLLAKNRMNQFYHPELTTTETTTGAYDVFMQESPALVQVQAHTQREEPPEFGKSKSQQGNGVINMIQGLVTETDKTVAEAEFNEKEAQKYYEDFMADAKAKRQADVKATADKQKMRAELESDKVKKTTSMKSETAELKDVEEYVKDLDEECSWLLQNYEYRKTHRAQEKESLVEAKGILAGAQ